MRQRWSRRRLVRLGAAAAAGLDDINRALGHLLQVRFNVRPEVTLFTLEPGSSAPRSEMRHLAEDR